MTFETRRDRHSAEVKSKILDAADKFIAEYGVDALTVKNLCQSAGVSNGSFFHYFASKDELVSAYMQFAYDRYSETIPFIEDSTDYLKNIIDIHIHNIKYAKILGVNFTRCYYNINNPNLRNRGNMDGERYSRYVMAQLALAKESGYISSPSPLEEVGADICMVAKGVIFEWGLCGDSFDVEAYLYKMLKMYLWSIASKEYCKRYQATLQ